MRINIESVFEQFDSQLSAALAKAALQTVPGMTTKTALRLYRTFRRNAIIALSPWEKVPSAALSGDTTKRAPARIAQRSRRSKSCYERVFASRFARQLGRGRVEVIRASHGRGIILIA